MAAKLWVRFQELLSSLSREPPRPPNPLLEKKQNNPQQNNPQNLQQHGLQSQQNLLPPHYSSSQVVHQRQQFSVLANASSSTTASTAASSADAVYFHHGDSSNLVLAARQLWAIERERLQSGEALRKFLPPLGSAELLELRFRARGEARRRAVTQWVDSVVASFGWRRSTFFVALHLLDSLLLHGQQENVPLSVLSVAALLLAALLVEDHASMHRVRNFTRSVPGVFSEEQVTALQWDMLAAMPQGLLLFQTPEELATLAIGRLLCEKEVPSFWSPNVRRDEEDWVAPVMDSVLVMATATYEDGCYAALATELLVAACMTVAMAAFFDARIASDASRFAALAAVAFRFDKPRQLLAALAQVLPPLRNALQTSARPEAAVALGLLAAWQAESSHHDLEETQRDERRTEEERSRLHHKAVAADSRSAAVGDAADSGTRKNNNNDYDDNSDNSDDGDRTSSDDSSSFSSGRRVILGGVGYT